MYDNLRIKRKLSGNRYAIDRFTSKTGNANKDDSVGSSIFSSIKLIDWRNGGTVWIQVEKNRKNRRSRVQKLIRLHGSNEISNLISLVIHWQDFLPSFREFACSLIHVSPRLSNSN